MYKHTFTHAHPYNTHTYVHIHVYIHVHIHIYFHNISFINYVRFHAIGGVTFLCFQFREVEIMQTCLHLSTVSIETCLLFNE